MTFVSRAEALRIGRLAGGRREGVLDLDSARARLRARRGTPLTVVEEERKPAPAHDGPKVVGAPGGHKR